MAGRDPEVVQRRSVGVHGHRLSTASPQQRPTVTTSPQTLLSSFPFQGFPGPVLFGADLGADSVWPSSWERRTPTGEPLQLSEFVPVLLSLIRPVLQEKRRFSSGAPVWTSLCGAWKRKWVLSQPLRTCTATCLVVSQLCPCPAQVTPSLESGTGAGTRDAGGSIGCGTS